MSEARRPEEQRSLRPLESHRRRVTRLLVALGLTVLGFAWPVVYVGYAPSLMWFVPAAVLEGLAIARPSDRGSMIIGLVLLLPTTVGVVIGVFHATKYLVAYDGATLKVGVATAVSSLFAAVAGRRRPRHARDT